MAERLFFAANGAMPTTAAVAGVTTGTAIKTLLQIATPSTTGITVVEWGISFDGAPSAIKCELVETDVAATVTAHVAAGVQPYSVADGTASVMTLGTAATGYTASAEGTTTATKYADVQYLSTNTYVKQFVLSREFVVKPSKFLRVRVTAAAAVNATCYVIWGE
jgi:hypothetical protein